VSFPLVIEIFFIAGIVSQSFCFYTLSQVVVFSAVLELWVANFTNGEKKAEVSKYIFEQQMISKMFKSFHFYVYCSDS
jgi:ABC-type uncharacterized transport system permease subunit